MTHPTAPHRQHGQYLDEDQAGPWRSAWPELAVAGVALAGCSAGRLRPGRPPGRRCSSS